jgi:ligand-binding SRPBCC domain-containing protein
MHFVKESRMAATPERVFAFHESPDALRRLTPPWERMTIVEGGESIRKGSRVVFWVGVGPFRMRWVARHTEYDPPERFVDEQESGPFARWRHVHRFLDDGEGGTRLRDEIDFDPPLGWLGRRLGGAYLLRKLETMFAYRHEMTRRIVESGESADRPDGAMVND